MQFPITALRELTILKRMKHPNIVDMVEVVVGHKQVPPVAAAPISEPRRWKWWTRRRT